MRQKTPERAIVNRITSLENPNVFWKRSPHLTETPCMRQQNVKHKNATKRVLYLEGSRERECITSKETPEFR
jgi:hypothetical protein